MHSLFHNITIPYHPNDLIIYNNTTSTCINTVNIASDTASTSTLSTDLSLQQNQPCILFNASQ
eukprot:UN09965